MSVKRILCKYFSEEDKKTVTLGSIIDNSIDYATRIETRIICMFGVLATILITLIGVKIAVYSDSSINSVSIYIISFIYGFVAIALSMGIIYITYLLYTISHKIKITYCERKD